jgi:hypothetical protein
LIFKSTPKTHTKPLRKLVKKYTRYAVAVSG